MTNRDVGCFVKLLSLFNWIEVVHFEFNDTFLFALLETSTHRFLYRF